MSAAWLLSRVAGHTERFIVGGSLLLLLLFFFSSWEDFGCNFELQSRYLLPPTAHRPRECLELACRQGRVRTEPDGVRSHFYVSARHWCQFATSCRHLSALPIKGSGMLTKPEMPGLHPGQHPAQPSARTPCSVCGAGTIAAMFGTQVFCLFNLHHNLTGWGWWEPRFRCENWSSQR